MSNKGKGGSYSKGSTLELNIHVDANVGNRDGGAAAATSATADDRSKLVISPISGPASPMSPGEARRFFPDKSFVAERDSGGGGGLPSLPLPTSPITNPSSPMYKRGGAQSNVSSPQGSTFLTQLGTPKGGKSSTASRYAQQQQQVVDYASARTSVARHYDDEDVEDEAPGKRKKKKIVSIYRTLINGHRTDTLENPSGTADDAFLRHLKAKRSLQTFREKKKWDRFVAVQQAFGVPVIDAHGHVLEGPASADHEEDDGGGGGGGADEDGGDLNGPKTRRQRVGASASARTSGKGAARSSKTTSSSSSSSRDLPSTFHTPDMLKVHL